MTISEPKFTDAGLEAYARQHGYRLWRVTPEDRPVLAALERLWGGFQASDPRIPSVLFNLTPGRLSACAAPDWGGSVPVIDLNLLHADGTKLTGRELLEYLGHMAAHGASAREETSSSEGRFHSVSFRDAAAGLGLDAKHSGKGLGFGELSLARGTLTRYHTEVAAIDRAMKTWEPVQVRRRNRGPVRMVCECDPPRLLRATKGTAEIGQITCGICGALFRVG